MSIRETRFGRLVDHFLSGFLHNDFLFSSETGMENTLSQAVALVVTPGLFYCVLSLFRYSAIYYPTRDTLTWPDKLLFVDFAMILTGILTVVEWEALFPDARDYQILSPLPLTTRMLFLAKVSSALLLLVVFWAAANLCPAVLFPSVVLTVANSWPEFARYVLAHIVSTLSASAFVFLFLIGVEGILLNVLSPRWFRRASVYAQLAAVLLLVFSLFLLPLMLARSVAWVQGNSPWVHALPPFWFLGLYQVLVGRGGPVFTPLAAMAVKGLAAAAAGAALAYIASYQRHVRRSLESLDAVRSGPGPLARAAETVLNVLVLRHPVERACFHFIRVTLLRSRVHRLLIAAYVGVGLALVLGGAAISAQRSGLGRPAPGLLSVQLVLSFFVLSGLRFAFAIPAELRANWLFQATEPADTKRCGAAVRKSVLVFGACPVLLALFPLHGILWGWSVAAAHLLYGGILSALLAELLLLTFDKIPFTCTYLPGKANVKALWPVYLTFFLTYAYTMARMEYGLMARPARFAIFCTAVAAIIAGLRWYSGRQFGPEFHFLFEDLPDPAIRTLDISH